MLAQCLAYIDRYGHPDPDNPPKIVGHECAIELINQNIKPVRVKPRPLNPLESASMSQRTTYMKAAEQLVNSWSGWGSPILLIPYLDRIEAFMKKHGDQWEVAARDPVNNAEMRALYRYR
jgi:hypothetical protein